MTDHDATRCGTGSIRDCTCSCISCTGARVSAGYSRIEQDAEGHAFEASLLAQPNPNGNGPKHASRARELASQ